MAYMITPDCIACGACEPECPNMAVSEVGEIYVIDPEKCTECIGFYETPKCVEVCPIDNCCIPDPNRKESEEQLLEKFKRLHPDKTPKLFD